MNRFSILFAFGLLFAGGAAAAPERMGFDVPPGFGVANYQEVPNQALLIEMIREGDTIEDWEELFTFENWALRGDGLSPETTLKKLMDAREERCPGVTVWNVISKEKQRIVYEWQSGPCDGWPEQHEIVLMCFGKWNVWRLRYTAKVHEIPVEERAYWIELLSKARVH